MEIDSHYTMISSLIYFEFNDVQVSDIASLSGFYAF